MQEQFYPLIPIRKYKTNKLAMRRSTAPRKRRGAVLVLMVVLLPVVLLLAAFTINLAYMELNRTEMYVAADAAARAGGRELAVSGDQADARAKAKTFGLLNEIASHPLELADGDLVFGTSQRFSSGRYSFTPGDQQPNSLQVTANRTSGSLDGPIPLLMPNLLGRNHFESTQVAISTTIQADIALVIDRSGSMAFLTTETDSPAASLPPGWQFCDPAPADSRWRSVLTAIGVFLDEVAKTPNTELVSISTYADTAITNQDLTSEYALILQALVPYTNSFCLGSTNIGGGIHEGLGALAMSPEARPHSWKAVVVLTDGKHNTGQDPVAAAQAAAAAGVQVFTVTFSQEADQSKMKEVASAGAGRHFHADSAEDLANVFQEIVKFLPTLLTQ